MEHNGGSWQHLAIKRNAQPKSVEFIVDDSDEEPTLPLVTPKPKQKVDVLVSQIEQGTSVYHPQRPALKIGSIKVNSRQPGEENGIIPNSSIRRELSVFVVAIVIQQPTQHDFNELAKLKTELVSMQQDEYLPKQLQKIRGIHTLASRSPVLPGETGQKLEHVADIFKQASDNSAGLRRQMGVVTDQVKRLMDLAKEEERENLQVKQGLNVSRDR